MARAFDIRVIAEGVETDDQLQFLRDQGCYEFQGYLLSRPLPPDALNDMIHSAAAYTNIRRNAHAVQKALSTDH